MLVLALDTTTRAGSVALARDGVLVEALVGDASRTHATRLPGDILGLLARHGRSLPEVDLFAVAAGPGSFTGLRIGIATIQGLSFASQRPVVGVSALEALAHSADVDHAAVAPPGLVGAWMDAQRGEVYAELYRTSGDLEVLQPAAVGEPAQILEAWAQHVPTDRASDLLLIGDGAVVYRPQIEARFPAARIVPVVPPIAPAIAVLAARAAARGLAGPPHAIRPLYVRRPDAELARDRKRAAGETQASGAGTAGPRSRTHG
jgi:tRNA threonylcarbamoyladenosine biosynthesis protein TsaB